MIQDSTSFAGSIDRYFKLLITCIFLNKTLGDRAIPQLRRFLQAYPEPRPLSESSYEDIKPFFKNLSLFHRASWLIDFAKEWLIHPPTVEITYQKNGIYRPTFRVRGCQTKGTLANIPVTHGEFSVKITYTSKLVRWRSVLNERKSDQKTKSLSLTWNEEKGGKILRFLHLRIAT